MKLLIPKELVYPLNNMQNFPQQSFHEHQYLRNKRYPFPGFSQKQKIAYLEYASNLEHFEKKDEHPSLVISEIIDSERVGYLNV